MLTPAPSTGSCSSSDSLPAAVRDFTENDRAFVYDSWLNSYCDAGVALWGCNRSTFFSRERRRIDSLLSRGAELKVATVIGEGSIILGWMCAEPPVLHYCYVKEAYRRQGVALQLLNAVGLSAVHLIPCTHWTPMAEMLGKPWLRRADL